MRIGFGYDVHQFTPGRPLWLGGIEVPHDRGLLGHSDADVAIHALCDALLGATAMRDIGYHFPDTKGNEYEGIDSKILLRRVMTESGFVTCVSEWWHFNHIPSIRAKEELKIIDF